jgi:hypothetical protein
VTRAYALFIARRKAIPHDGTRQIIADGHVERQDAAAAPDDDALVAEMAEAMREVPGEETARDTGRAAWQQRGERP